MATTQPHRLRPGTWADIPRAATLYTLAFKNDQLMQFLFPEREKYPHEWHAAVQRIFQLRYWTLGWRFTVLVDGDNEPQAFTWWNRGKGYESFWRRWLSPTWWFAPVVRLFLTIRNKLRPFKSHTPDYFSQIVHHEEEKFLNTPRRKAAHYLSIAGVHPKLQGTGLGSFLIHDGLREVDRLGVAAWLIRLKGLGPFYEKFGFKGVGTVAVGKLEKWDGGEVMFRE